MLVTLSLIIDQIEHDKRSRELENNEAADVDEDRMMEEEKMDAKKIEKAENLESLMVEFPSGRNFEEVAN